MPAKALEVIKPKFDQPRLVRNNDRLEFSTQQNENPVQFSLSSELYLISFIQGLSIQEIVLQENKSRRHVDFILLKEILSNLYWSHQLVNEKEFSRSFAALEGPPAFDSLISSPIIEFSLDRDIHLLVLMIPILCTIIFAKLFLSEHLYAFYILFFPQIFLCLKALISMAASRFIFDNPEPMSLYFSPLGPYFHLSSGKRTAISISQYLVHLTILFCLGVAGFFYFYQIQDPLLHKLGPLSVILVFVIQLSPFQNTDLSNFRYFILAHLRRLKSLSISPSILDQIAKISLIKMNIIYHLISLGFFAYCGVLSLQFLKAKNYEYLVFQIIFDIAALAAFVDLVDQFEFALPINSAKGFSPFISKFIEEADVFRLLRAIPIFEGLSEKSFKQMAEVSRLIDIKAGARLFKNGDKSSELYIVIKGQIAIYKNQTKIIEINAGAIFGEGAFLLNRPRVGSAYALENSKLLRMSRPQAFLETDRTETFNLTQFQKKIWAFQALSQSELFKDLPSESLMSLITHGSILELAPKALVVRQGEASDSLWIIVQGRCKVLVDQNEVREMGSREVFGEIGVLWNTSRTSSVLTIESSIFLKISALHIWELMAKNLNLAKALQELGEKRLESARPR